MRVQLHPAQRFILQSNKPKKVYIGGRVCGKTRAAVVASIQSAANWNRTDVLCPKHDIAMQFRERVLEIIEQSDMKFETNTQHTIELELGREINFWSTQGAGWEEDIKESPCVVVEEAQKVPVDKLKNIIGRPKVFIASQNHAKTNLTIDYEEDDDWEYVIAPTTMNPEVSGAMLEKQAMSFEKRMFGSDFMIHLMDLSNRHTLAVPNQAYPYWKLQCLGCNFSETVDVRDGMNSDVKEYLIGKALHTDCQP